MTHASGAWLVVVADDAGIDVPRNRGIVHAHREGLVTCTSVLAVGPAFDDMAARARETPELGIGLHLDLTEGRALTGSVPGLTDASGRFCGDKREVWRRALAGHVEPDAVRVEAEAQLARLAGAGLAPVHVDGHQHVHLLPGVREGLAAALASFPSVAWVRAPRRLACPAAPGPWSAWPALAADRLRPDLRPLAAAGLRAHAALATLTDESDVLRTHGRRSADVFAGPDLVEDFTPERLLRRLETALALLVEDGTADGGVVELMTHPGERCEESVGFSSSAERESECGTLCDPEVRREIERRGFRVASFAEVGA